MKTLKRRRGLPLGVMMSDLVLAWGSTPTPSCKSQVSESRSSRTPPTPIRLHCELTLTAPENSHNALLFA